MSLPLDQVTSPPGLVEDFKCAICLQLVSLAEAVVTPCAHVYDGPCLASWLKRSGRCPTCNADGAERAASLKAANPLAFRVLGRVRVRCSLAGCAWEGDYSELEAHVTSSDAHADKSAAVAGMKATGNERFQRGDFDGAIAAYTKAINVLSASSASATTTTTTTPALQDMQSQLYANRAAALLHVGKPLQAAEDCARALRTGSVTAKEDAKLYVRWSRALTEAGDFHQAAKVFEAAPAHIKPLLGDAQRKAESLETSFAMARDAVDRSDTVAARAHLAPLLQDAGASRASRVLALTAVVEASSGSTELANRLSLEALRHCQDAEWAWTSRSRVLLTVGDFDGARRAARQALTLNPDDAASKDALRAVKTMETLVNAARDAVEAHNYPRAKELFTQATEPPTTMLPESSPLRVQLLAEKADVAFRGGEYEEGLRDAGRAIYLKDDNPKAWATRFHCLRHLGRHEEAVRDGRLLLERWGSADPYIRSLVEKAEFELRKAQRPDLYGVLGVGALASELEIKAAYKKKSLEVHPDKASPADRDAATEKFKLLGIALDVLGNREKRELWDKGFDVLGIDEELQRRRHFSRPV